MLGRAGLMVHVFDGYENHEALWEAREPDISSSLVFAAQHAPSEWMSDTCWGTKEDERACHHPMFTDTNAGDAFAGAGLILRPGATPLKCGKAGDSGGHCSSFCPSLPPNEDVTFDTVNMWDHPGDGCGQSWKPEDIGPYLKRLAKWQVRKNRLEHNEFIVGRDGWNGHLPRLVDAFFIRRGFDAAATREQHEKFLQKYDLREADVPFVELDIAEWHNPLRPI